MQLNVLDKKYVGLTLQGKTFILDSDKEDTIIRVFGKWDNLREKLEKIGTVHTDEASDHVSFKLNSNFTLASENNNFNPTIQLFFVSETRGKKVIHFKKARRNSKDRKRGFRPYITELKAKVLNS